MQAFSQNSIQTNLGAIFWPVITVSQATDSEIKLLGALLGLIFGEVFSLFGQRAHLPWFSQGTSRGEKIGGTHNRLQNEHSHL